MKTTPIALNLEESPNKKILHLGKTRKVRDLEGNEYALEKLIKKIKEKDGFR